MFGDVHPVEQLNGAVDSVAANVSVPAPRPVRDKESIGWPNAAITSTGVAADGYINVQRVLFPRHGAVDTPLTVHPWKMLRVSFGSASRRTGVFPDTWEVHSASQRRSLLISTCEPVISPLFLTLTVNVPFVARTDAVFALFIVTVQVGPVPLQLEPHPRNALPLGEAVSVTFDPGGKVKEHAPPEEGRAQLIPAGLDKTVMSPLPKSETRSVGLPKRAVIVVALARFTAQMAAVPHPPPL